jgi:hypothetical protein
LEVLMSINLFHSFSGVLPFHPMSYFRRYLFPYTTHADR